MKSSNISVLKGAIIVVFLLVMMVFLPTSNFLNKTLNESEMIPIEEQVSFQLNEEPKKVLNIAEYSFPAPHRGDRITLQKILPDKKVEHPVLVLELYHCAVDVYLDEEQIYTYGQNLYEQKEVLGHEFLRVHLPEDFAGKELKVVLTVTEEDGFTSIEDTYILNEGASYSNILAQNFLTLLSSLTLITFGIIGIGAGLASKNKERDIHNIIWISCFSIIVALWMLCNDDIMFMLVSNMQVVNIIEFFAIYTMGIPAALFFSNIQQKKRWQNLFLGYAMFMLGVNILIIAVHLLNIDNYIVWIPVMHVVLLGLILLVIVMLARTYQKNEGGTRVLIYGMIFMVFVGLFEMLRFNMHKYLNEILSKRFSLMPIGTLIFVGSMVYSYCIRILKSYQDKAEQELIEKMAYTDMLTNTYNRNKCEKILEQMEEKRTSGYLVSMDLNGLKQVNDTYGHSRGDEMLVNFSKILNETFDKEYCAVGRMGGDEFVVIIFGDEEHKVVSILKKLNENILHWNKKQDGDTLSVAYGYAFYDGAKNSSVQHVYEKADQKMYESKREIKSQEEGLVL